MIRTTLHFHCLQVIWAGGFLGADSASRSQASLPVPGYRESFLKPPMNKHALKSLTWQQGIVLLLGVTLSASLLFLFPFFYKWKLFVVYIWKVSPFLGIAALAIWNLKKR